MAKEGAKKILRVGIIQGGRIVEERLIRKREAHGTPVCGILGLFSRATFTRERNAQ